MKWIHKGLILKFFVGGIGGGGGAIHKATGGTAGGNGVDGARTQLNCIGYVYNGV